MADDCRISTALPRHPKFVKLKRRLGADGCLSLIILFLWVAANRYDGNLDGMAVEDLEIAAEWQGGAGEFVAAIADVGFLDGKVGEYCIHDWPEHNPWAAHRGERIAAAQSAARVRWGRNGTSATVKCDADADRIHSACATHAERNETAMPSTQRTPPNETNDSSNKVAHPGDERASISSRKQGAELEMLASGIYSEYPRKVGKADALKAIVKSIRSIARRDRFAGDVSGAAEWLRERVGNWANSPQCRRTKQEFVPYPATWFNAARYDDAETEWGFNASGARNAKTLSQRLDEMYGPDPLYGPTGFKHKPDRSSTHWRCPSCNVVVAEGAECCPNPKCPSAGRAFTWEPDAA